MQRSKEICEAVRRAAENAVLAGERMQTYRDVARAGARQRAKDECVGAVWGAFAAAVPSHTDLMVDPDSLDAFMAANPLPPERKFGLKDKVRKIKGSEWNGVVVGFYSTALTPVGYAVESACHAGSVQIYPEAALESDE